MLRGLQRWGPTRTGLLQLLSDLPGIGELIEQRPSVAEANQQPPALTWQLLNTPVGAAAAFGVIASTVVFTASHLPRDWPGCVACGLVWCWLVWATNKGTGNREQEAGSYAGSEERSDEGPGSPTAPRNLGLGPVIWSHALVNALLWGYTLWSGDWQFL